MKCRIATILILLAAGFAQANDITVVHVKPGQTLNAAIAGVEGPICIMLPPGVTERLRGLLARPFENLLPAHGDPVLGGARERYRPAIEALTSGP